MARLAVDRIGGRDYVVGDSPSIADVTLAAMAAPLQFASPAVRGDAAVRDLLDWARGILGGNFTAREVSRLAAA